MFGNFAFGAVNNGFQFLGLRAQRLHGHCGGFAVFLQHGAGLGRHLLLNAIGERRELIA